MKTTHNTSNAITVTSAQALAILKEQVSTWASFYMVTPQNKLNKGRGANAMQAVLGYNPDNIMKHAFLTALVGTKVTYQTLVENRQMDSVEGLQAPTFEAEERKWGSRVDGVEVTHNGKQYITLHCVAANKPQVEYYHDGELIDIKDSAFDAWRKPAKVEGAKQLAAGVDNPVVYRDYTLAHVVSFKVDGQVYLIDHTATAA